MSLDIRLDSGQCVSIWPEGQLVSYRYTGRCYMDVWPLSRPPEHNFPTLDTHWPLVTAGQHSLQEPLIAPLGGSTLPPGGATPAKIQESWIKAKGDLLVERLLYKVSYIITPALWHPPDLLDGCPTLQHHFAPFSDGQGPRITPRCHSKSHQSTTTAKSPP